MYEKAVLVHGYWISEGACLVSEKQADAAARAYLRGEVNLIVIPTSEGEWGQGSIGEFIRKRILTRYPEISPVRVIALDDKSVVNTKKEASVGLEYLQLRGVSTVLDLAAPFHAQRVKWIIDELERCFYGQKYSFTVEYKTTSDYLTEEENAEFLGSGIYEIYVKSEKLRTIIFKNKILNFLSDLVPDQLKIMMEAVWASNASKAGTVNVC